MIKELIKLANHLDKKGLMKEADYVDWIIKKSQETVQDGLPPKLRESLDKFLHMKNIKDPTKEISLEDLSPEDQKLFKEILEKNPFMNRVPKSPELPEL